MASNGLNFGPDNKVFRWISNIGNSIILNVIWTFSCFFGITIGAATSAFYYSFNKNIVKDRGEGLAKEFFKSFKDCFKVSTLIWILQALLLGICYVLYQLFDVYGETNTNYNVAKYIVLIVAAFIVVWVFYSMALVSRFENDCFTTMKNGFVLMMTNPRATLTVAVMVGFVGFACYLFIPCVMFLPVLCMRYINLELEQLFKKFMTPEDLEADSDEIPTDKDFHGVNAVAAEESEFANNSTEEDSSEESIDEEKEA